MQAAAREWLKAGCGWSGRLLIFQLAGVQAADCPLTRLFVEAAAAGGGEVRFVDCLWAFCRCQDSKPELAHLLATTAIWACSSPLLPVDEDVQDWLHRNAAFLSLTEHGCWLFSQVKGSRRQQHWAVYADGRFTPAADDQAGAAMQQQAADQPFAALPFNIFMTPQQAALQAALPLPHYAAKQQQQQQPADISYWPDVHDDYEEEDPDADLEF